MNWTRDDAGWIDSQECVVRNSLSVFFCSPFLCRRRRLCRRLPVYITLRYSVTLFFTSAPRVVFIFLFAFTLLVFRIDLCATGPEQMPVRVDCQEGMCFFFLSPQGLTEVGAAWRRGPSDSRLPAAAASASRVWHTLGPEPLRSDL